MRSWLEVTRSPKLTTNERPHRSRDTASGCDPRYVRARAVVTAIAYLFPLTPQATALGFDPGDLVYDESFADPILPSTPEVDTIEARVNGEVRQDARTCDFVHPIPRCIAHVSRYMRLDPGDVILTGSPSGVGYFRGVFLKAGDVVEMEADRIGVLRNPIIDS